MQTAQREELSGPGLPAALPALGCHVLLQVGKAAPPPAFISVNTPQQDAPVCAVMHAGMRLRGEEKVNKCSQGLKIQGFLS